MGAWISYGIGAGYLIPLPQPWNILAMTTTIIGTGISLRYGLRFLRQLD